MRRRRIILLGAILLVAVVAATTVAVDRLGAEKGTGGATPQGTSSVAHDGGYLRDWPADLILPSQRAFKADLIEHLGYAPEVIFFGGSRSTRFEPSYLTEKTGLKGFNLAMTNGKPEDAWAFAHFLHARSPDTTLRWIWGIQSSTMYDREFDSALIQDPRLNKYFPDDLLRAEARQLPQDPADMPAEERGKNTRWADDGALLWNTYDTQFARGLTLTRSLEVYIEKALKKGGGADTAATPKPPSRARTYFEKTLGYLNRCGVTPIFISMPMHPEVLEVMRAEGRQKYYPRFLAYIDGLHERYDFEFIDLKEIESFGGDPDQFYDGVHITAVNARKVIDELVRAYPEQFEE